MPASPAASSTASVLARPPMLPGLMRSFAAPRLAASMAMFASKWMSATTGKGDRSHTAWNTSRLERCGMAMRTISQPACASASICARFAATSVAGAFSMDCTTTGAPPPSGTEPTDTRRVASLGLACVATRASRSPSPTACRRGAGTASQQPAGCTRPSASPAILPLITRFPAKCTGISRAGARQRTHARAREGKRANESHAPTRHRTTRTALEGACSEKRPNLPSSRVMRTSVIPERPFRAQSSVSAQENARSEVFFDLLRSRSPVSKCT